MDWFVGFVIGFVVVFCVGVAIMAFLRRRPRS